MNDIFIDNNTACLFNNNIDEEYKQLYDWLIAEGCLVVSNHILSEYNRTNAGSNVGCSILIIISHLTKAKRLNRIGNKDINTFMKSSRFVHFNFTSDGKDRKLVATIMLSDRHLAISQDRRLVNDMKIFPKFKGVIDTKPSKVPYA